MEENIKVQAEDTQKVEYLDKNGLDLLWTKVKKNAQDQVEVEYNRAKGKEDEITASIKEEVNNRAEAINNLKYIPYTQKVNQTYTIKDGYLEFDGGYGIGVTNSSLTNTNSYIDSQYIKVSSNNTKININAYDKKIAISNGANIVSISPTGISKSLGSHTEAFSTNGGVIDTATFALKSELTDYAKKTELPEAGKVDDVRVNEESVVVNKIANIDLAKYATQQYVTDAINTDHNTTNINLYRNFTNFDLDQDGDGLTNLSVTTDNTGLSVAAIGSKNSTQTSLGQIQIGADKSNLDLGCYIKFSEGTDTGLTLTKNGIINPNYYEDREGFYHVYTANGGEINLKEHFVENNIESQETNATYYSLQCHKDDNDNWKEFDLKIKNTGIYIGDGATTTKINPNEITTINAINAGDVSINGNGDYISIVKSGKNIGSPEHAFTTDGGTVDLSEYAKKSEITASGNVDDVQINGTSVVEDKVAKIKLATKDDFGVVKVGNGLDVKDGVVGVDTDAFADLLSYGIEWDTTVANPACTRIGNQLYHKSLPVQSRYKGCLVKNGKVNYYLDPNDWSKKADGAASVLDGTDGDVMVHIPKFYGKSGSNGDKRWVRISLSQIDSTWVEIPEMFVSAYRITTYSDSGTTKVASVVNTSTGYRGGSNRSANDQYLDTDKFRTDLGKPRTSLSRAAMRTNAKNSGQELLCYEFYKWIFYWAYVIEYANFNSQLAFNSELTSDGCHQGGLGSGLTTFDYNQWDNYNSVNPLTPCGYTNELGNFSGVKSLVIPETKINDTTTISTKTLSVNRWRGFENPFGDIWTNLDGVNIMYNAADALLEVSTTADSSKFSDDFGMDGDIHFEIPKDGYIKEFDLGETGEIIPSDVGASESTYKCDYYYCNASYLGNKTLLVGGHAYYGGKAGLGSFGSYCGVGHAFSNVGFRSVIRA